MKLHLLLVSLFCGLSFALFAQKWSVKDPFEQKVFIENNGRQFDGGASSKSDKVLYSATVTGIVLYFTADGVTYKYNKAIADTSDKKDSEEKDKIAMKLVPSYFSFKWQGANPNLTIVSGDEERAYSTYRVGGHNIVAHEFKKLVYKNVYPDIDVEYSFSLDRPGLEYKIILHSGADLAKVKLMYSNAEQVSRNENGDIEILSSFGTFIDHASVNTFYQENGNKVKCEFKLKGNEVSFSTGRIDRSKTLVIVPWVINPAFTGYDKGYDLDYDFAGNVYVYGGLPPYQVEKYNSLGILQWTNNLPFDTTELWVGDLTVDHRSGSVYVFKGLSSFSIVSAAVKLSNTGIVLDTIGYNFNGLESWRVRFDYCNNQLVVGAGQNWQAYTVDTNLSWASASPANVLNAASSDDLHDMTLLALDQSGNAYMATNRPSFSTGYDNILLKASLPFLYPVNYSLYDGYAFIELTSLVYYPYQSNGQFGYSNGFNGMAANKDMLVTYDGSVLKKWKPSTGILQNSAAVTSTRFLWGGLDIDCADNIYVGNYNNIDIYDSSLSYISSLPLADTVYDVKLGNSNAYACGKNFVASTPYTSSSVSLYVKSTPPSSCSACNGKAAAYIEGCGSDSAGYSYMWSTGATTAIDTGLCYGNYTVTVSLNCLQQYVDSVSFPSITSGGMTINVTTNGVSCGNTNNGNASVVASGGNPPYSYSWSPSGTTTSSVSGLAAGTYSVVVTDNSGNCISGICIVNQAPRTTLNITKLTNETCAGADNGVVVIAASSGTAPYTYNWQPSGGTADSLSGLSVGVYTVTVTDANGCISKDSATIIDGFANMVKVTTTNSCGGEKNGTANVSVPNSGFYIINWSTGGSNSNSIAALGEGKYYVTVRDSNTGCIVTDTFQIFQYPTPIVNTTQVNEKCFGESMGSANAIASGGSGSTYVYSWSNGNISSGITNASAGSYTVTITDSLGCKAMATVNITQPPQIIPVINKVNTTCNSNNGSASVSVTGGNAPYTYSWLPSGSTNASINNLAPGNYSLIITDTNGCVVKDSVAIIASVPNVNIVGDDSVCAGGNDVLTVSGGVGYSWNTGATTSSVTVSPTVFNTYSVVVLDSNGCKDSLYKTIVVKQLPTVSACCGATVYSGQSVQLSASGGISYIWAPGLWLTCSTCPDPIVSPLQTEAYVVTVSGSDGCTVNDSVIINVKTCGEIFVPTAFSPNNDGQNDKLYVFGDCIKTMQFEVFDRWGNKVFETNDLSTPWDGMYKGEPMNSATFVYYLNVTLLDGATVIKKGNVTLVR